MMYIMDSLKIIIPTNNSKSSSSSQGEQLKLPDIPSDKLNYTESVAKKMRKLFQRHKSVVPFVGDAYLETLFYLYLFKKYKMNCILADPRRGVINLFLTFSLVDPEYTTRENRDTISAWSDKIFDCIDSGEKIIIIPFAFNICIDDETPFAHANLLIYRRIDNRIELFEPHGESYMGIGGDVVFTQISIAIEELVIQINQHITNDNFLKNKQTPLVILSKSYEACPVIYGPQAIEELSNIPKNKLIEPIGYCSAWSMFFAELCLKNPEMPSIAIYSAIIDQTNLYDNRNDYLRNIIRGYTCFINNKIAKHFSPVFDMHVSSVKLHKMIFDDKDNSDTSSLDPFDYEDKYLEIIDLEKGDDKQTDVKDRYKEFVKNIRSETSSASLKSEDRLTDPPLWQPHSPHLVPHSPHSPYSPHSPHGSPPHKTKDARGHNQKNKRQKQSKKTKNKVKRQSKKTKIS